MAEQRITSNSKSALRRLLLVLTFTIGILIYSYGWTVTEIDLTLPQEERRQETLTRALRELLSPRLFVQERELVTYDVPFLMDCNSAITLPDSPEQVQLEPACAASNEIVTIRVTGINASAEARLRWIPPAIEGTEVNERPIEIIELDREEFVLDATGSFTGTLEVPRIRGGEGQIHYVRVLVAIPSGLITFSDTANQVMYRMVQTIFMALVATTVAIPIATLISFFAAHNLMKGVRLSVGSMLLALIVFCLGCALGYSYVKEIAIWGLLVGKGELFQPLGALFAFLIPAIILAMTLFVLRFVNQNPSNKEKHGDTTPPLQRILSTLITSLSLVFLVGAIGGLGILGGEQIMQFADSLRPSDTSSTMNMFGNAGLEALWSIGNVLIILGTLVDLFIAPVVAIILGFALSSLASGLFAGSLREIHGLSSRIIAALMAAISAAILMVLVAALGLWAALFSILPALVGAFLGAQVLLQLSRLVWKPVSPLQIDATRGREWLERIVSWIGFGLVFFLMFNQLNIARSLVDGSLPSQNAVNIFGMELPISAYIFNSALIGAILAGLSGALAGLHAVFPLGDMLYSSSRTSLNIVRSIEPLIMGLVFVIWVGIGPFAGVLALTLHSIASLGKLYSEQIENIDEGPIEALQSTGANQLQTIIYGVVPQIIPPYIAFTMYRWDINVRMSTIIGFVGGGGIGLLLQQQINLLRYRDAGVAVLAIAVVVSILDYASAAIREHIN